MGLGDRIWGAFTAIIRLEDKVNRQADTIKSQQQRIEDLTLRMIRMEAQMELLMGVAMKRIRGEGQ